MCRDPVSGAIQDPVDGILKQFTHSDGVREVGFGTCTYSSVFIFVPARNTGLRIRRRQQLMPPVYFCFAYSTIP